MSKYCEILGCVCVTNLPSCIACDYYKRREAIKSGDGENYGVGEYGRCSKFGTEVVALLFATDAKAAVHSKSR